MSVALVLALLLGFDYDALVDRYRAGDAAAVGTLAAMRAADAKDGARRFRRESAGSNATLLRAAALLHTEAAFALRVQDHADAADAHLGLARGLVDDARRIAMERSPTPARSFECIWSLAVAYSFAGEIDLRETIRKSRATEEFCSEGAEFWVARGALHELLSHLRADRDFLDLFETSPEMRVPPPTNSGDRQRELARVCFQKACAIDPREPEAHLRLGRIYALAGRMDEATGELSWVLNNDRSRQRLYLAHLFLGESREAQGRWAEASLRYRAAHALVPDARSDSFALSYVRFMEGDHTGAAEALLSSLDPRPRASVDPWILYNTATPIGGFERAMDELRATIRATAR